jgi:hypothetical protein
MEVTINNVDVDIDFDKEEVEMMGEVSISMSLPLDKDGYVRRSKQLDKSDQEAYASG